MPDHETPEFRPAPEHASSTPRVIAAALACAVAAAAVWWDWLRPEHVTVAHPPVPAAP